MPYASVARSPLRQRQVHMRRFPSNLGREGLRSSRRVRLLPVSKRARTKETFLNGIKFSQEVRPERVTTNIVCILYHIITIHPLAPRRRPPLIILSLCSVYLAHNTPSPFHQSQIVCKQHHV